MGLNSVTPEQVHRMLKRGGATVLDLNPAEVHARVRVPGSRSLSFDTFTAADLPQDKQSPVVFLCSNRRCRKAPIATRRARAMGYTNAVVMLRALQVGPDPGWQPMTIKGRCCES